MTINRSVTATVPGDDFNAFIQYEVLKQKQRYDELLTFCTSCPWNDNIKVYICWRFCPQQGRKTFAGPVAVLSVITYVSDCTP